MGRLMVFGRSLASSIALRRTFFARFALTLMVSFRGIARRNCGYKLSFSGRAFIRGITQIYSNFLHLYTFYTRSFAKILRSINFLGAWKSFGRFSLKFYGNMLEKGLLFKANSK